MSSVATIKTQNLLYASLGIVTTFIIGIYITDSLLSMSKPNFIKINGKIDKSTQFVYSVSITFILFVIFIFIMYGIMA
jgi:hypothetical protein